MKLIKKFWKKIEWAIARRVLADRTKTIKNLIEIQGLDGNWNYNGYMQGMYNGIELCYSLLVNKPVNYKTAPKKWRCDCTVINSTHLDHKFAVQAGAPNASIVYKQI